MRGLNQDLDVRLLARWLGVQGIKAGLKESRYIRVVPLDNFMIYKYIIRLDRPD
ncbi:MAG: hypothetical protein [Olavius algarvensis Gamma 1 endosymbiont]|nr:MAG: hypothetical protein [Olavius algarvensis Gamma 1 endosymbiont]